MADILLAILHFIGQVIDWVVDFFQWLFVKLAVLLLDALIALLSLIPVPEWLEEISGNVLSVSPGIMYFLAPFQFGVGFAWVVSAYVLRFLIRRLPVVG